MPDYQLGKIYKITGNGLTYYGSTTQKYLSSRLCEHCSKYRLYLKGKTHFTTSFKCFENCNTEFQITLMELYPCNTKDELLAKERTYIEQNICVNKLISIRTEEENKQYNKDYYNLNKEKKKQLQCCLYCNNSSLKLHFERHCKTITHCKNVNKVNDVVNQYEELIEQFQQSLI